MCTALKYVCSILLKWRTKWSHPTDLLLQHLILLLRHKSNIIQSLLSEKSCILESFCWRAQLLYSTDETDHLYAIDKDSTCANTEVVSSDERGTSTLLLSDCGRFSKPHSICSPLDLGKSSPNGSDALSFNSMNAHNNLSKLNVLSSMISLKANSCPPLRTFVHCYDNTLSYGFEFLGASAHLSLTPQTEASLLSLVQAVGNRACPLINMTSSPSSQAVTGKDLSIVSQ